MTQVFGEYCSFYIYNSKNLIFEYVFEIFWWYLKFLVASEISVGLDVGAGVELEKKLVELTTLGWVRHDKGKI